MAGEFRLMLGGAVYGTGTVPRAGDFQVEVSLDLRWGYDKIAGFEKSVSVGLCSWGRLWWWW